MTEPRQPLGQPTGVESEGGLVDRDPDFSNEHDDTSVAGDVPGGPERTAEPESPDSHGGQDL